MRDCNDQVLLENDLESEPTLLPDFSCHVLRHTFATRICEAGVNLKVIQDMQEKINSSMAVYWNRRNSGSVIQRRGTTFTSTWTRWPG